MARLPIALSLLVFAACKKDDPPPAQPVQPVVTAQPSAAPVPSASSAPGEMSVPGPNALACSTDAQCLTHRCNVAYKKCAFPCRSDVDCLQGTTCVVGAGALAYCWAKPPGQ